MLGTYAENLSPLLQGLLDCDMPYAGYTCQLIDRGRFPRLHPTQVGEASQACV
jgi:hypothetical protein